MLGANALGRAVFAPLFDTAAPVPNIARFIFLDPAAQTFHVDWDDLAADAAALLRAEAGRGAAHDVRLHRGGVKRLHHPVVGELTLAYESLELVTDPGLRLNAYTAEPASAAREALDLLASWSTAPRGRPVPRSVE